MAPLKAALLTLIISLSLNACGGQTLLRIAVVNPSRGHGAKIIESFVTELETRLPAEAYVVDYPGLLPRRGDTEEFLTSLMEEKPDIVLAITQYALDAVISAEIHAETPVLAWSMDDLQAKQIAREPLRPDKNITGVITGVTATPAEELRLAWLKKLAPGRRTIWTPYNPGDIDLIQGLGSFMFTAADLELEPLLQPVRSVEDAQASLEAMPRDIEAVFLFGDRNIGAVRHDYYQECIRRKIPCSGPNSNSVREGALFSYSFIESSVGARLAAMAAQILRGTPVEEIPFETPDFGLAINLATAEKIGLEITETHLMQASLLVRD